MNFANDKITDLSFGCCVSGRRVKVIYDILTGHGKVRFKRKSDGPAESPFVFVAGEMLPARHVMEQARDFVRVHSQEQA